MLFDRKFLRICQNGCCLAASAESSTRVNVVRLLVSENLSKSEWILFERKFRRICQNQNEYGSTASAESAARHLNGLGGALGLASPPPLQEELREGEDAGHQ